jgi:metallo-beta-lactamase family protein
LRIVSNAEESKRINEVKEAVVLAGSGMCNGGRIVHHLKNSLFLETTDVVFVGYQARSTLGRRLVEGEKYVRVAGEEVAVKAKIHTINGFSAHADRRDLLAWARQFRTDPLFFITHGEQGSSLALAKTFEENGIRSFIPEEGGEYSLVGKKETALPSISGIQASSVPREVQTGRAIDAVLGDIVTLAAELKEDGSSVPQEEALNLALSARTLLKTLKRRGADD